MYFCSICAVVMWGFMSPVNISLIKCTLCLYWFISQMSCMNNKERTAKENGEEKGEEDTVQRHNADFNPHEKKPLRPHLETERGSGAAVQELSSGWASLDHKHMPIFCPVEDSWRRSSVRLHSGTHIHTQTLYCLYSGYLRTSLPSRQCNSVPSLQIKCVMSVFIVEHPCMGGWKSQWPNFFKPLFSVCQHKGCTKLKNSCAWI